MRCSTLWRSRAMSAPNTRASPEVGTTSPISMEMVVVLPAPLPPSSAVIEPARKREADAIDGGDVAIDLAQVPHVHGRRQGPIVLPGSVFASDVCSLMMGRDADPADDCGLGAAPYLG